MCWTGPDASICANSQPARLQMRQKQCCFSLHQAPVGLPMIESLLRRQQSLLLPHQHHDLSSLSVSFFGFCNPKFSVHDFCSHFDTLSSSSSLLQFTPLPPGPQYFFLSAHLLPFHPQPVLVPFSSYFHPCSRARASPSGHPFLRLPYRSFYCLFRRLPDILSVRFSPHLRFRRS